MSDVSNPEPGDLHKVEIGYRHRDVGLTLVTDVYVGDALAVSFSAQTRHEHIADQSADIAIAAALGKIIGTFASQSGSRVAYAQPLE